MKKKRGSGRVSDRVEEQVFPWADYQRLAFGCLRWQPSEFWRSNVWELTYAWEGYAQSKGISLDGDFMSQDDLEELMRKFPDKPKEEQ